MARGSKPSVLKRQRERKKAEKAATKREERAARKEDQEGSGSAVATRDDLAGYGLLPEDDDQDRTD